jgi:protoheme IX farnesyltransferase
MERQIRNYILLTKPTIMLLVLMGAGTALMLDGNMLSDPLRLAIFIFAVFMAGGSANALNQYFERNIDSRMSRTKDRRPLPLNLINPMAALLFSVVIGVSGVAILGIFFGWLTGSLALGTILFYSLVYTLWLKPHTDQNIVIGGIAGAMAPIGAWIASNGSLDITPCILFMIIFLWTPPHFWALAINYRDDYKEVGLPMSPVTRGTEATLKSILRFTLALVIISLTPLLVNSGWFYGVFAIILGLVYIYLAGKALLSRDDKSVRTLFRYSLIYLPSLFAALIVDHFLFS